MISINNLPELTGSEKQVAWANSIRAKRIEGFKKYIKFDLLENLDAIMATVPEDKKELTLVKANELIANLDRILGHTEAKWWIDTQTKISLEQLANA